MTTGHKHRVVRIRKGSRLHVLLTQPLVWSHEDLSRVDNSPYPWGPSNEALFQRDPAAPQPFYLSALSILHRWTGLTLQPEEKTDA